MPDETPWGLQSSAVNAASAGANQVPIANGSGGYTWNSSLNLVTAAANPALTNKLAAGDANPVFQINGDGTVKWGPGGGGALDTILVRTGGSATSSQLALKNLAGSSLLLSTNNVSQVHTIEALNADGSADWDLQLASRTCTIYSRAWGNSLQANSDGSIQLSASKVGFFTTAPIAKPTVTGSKGANAALTSLMAALASYGLVVDSTT